MNIGDRVKIIGTEIYGEVVKLFHEAEELVGIQLKSDHDGAPFDRPLEHVELIEPVAETQKADPVVSTETVVDPTKDGAQTAEGATAKTE